MPVEFLTDDEAAAYGRFAGPPSQADLERCSSVGPVVVFLLYMQEPRSIPMWDLPLGIIYEFASLRHVVHTGGQMTCTTAWVSGAEPGRNSVFSVLARM
ncbi:hypothetical protein B1L11_08120 [Microbispora sp. GKU 823]|nr:hypothetical protein B1L11_08120 [Microbispora sp. GKU 823]